jgi:linoleoyl-CoA desaturase
MTLPLSRSDVDEIQAELDALRAEIAADLGQGDARHIRRMIRVAQLSAVGGRTLLMLGIDPLSWAAGVMALAAAKILENMEIGHNVMHGQ